MSTTGSGIHGNISSPSIQASSLLQQFLVELHRLIAANLSYAVLILITGFLFSMRTLKGPVRSREGAPTKEWWSFAPIFTVVVLVLFMRIELHYALIGLVVFLFIFYRYRMKSIFVDAIETFNRRYIVGSANRQAARIAKKLGKPCVAGSDAHHARFVGFGRTFIDAERDIPSILAAIRAANVSCGGRQTPLRTSTHQSLNNTWRKIKRFTRRVRLR